MMIKEEPVLENEYTPIGSIVEDEFIDADDPKVDTRMRNIKK
jgi:hypothetical protein